jgi:E3 SUMO-protein ligase RanBP2
VIPLPEVVPVVTGEENEDILYCHRAKLYRFVEGEWKERGIGDFKILQHQTNKTIRYVINFQNVIYSSNIMCYL